MGSYTVTTQTGFLKRIGSAFGGIIVGIGLIVAGTILLWWNEGNFVATGDALTEAQAITQELGDINSLDPSKNSLFVHATGPTKTEDIVKDPIFGIEINAVRLERKVEFYQWVESSKTETRTKLGGGEEKVTTYTYSQKWVSSPVDSSNFKDPASNTMYHNTVLITLDDFRDQAKNVSFGAYNLPDILINLIRGANQLNVSLSEETVAALNGRLASASQGANANNTLPNTQMVHVSGSTVLLSASPNMPQTGDVRVTFTETPPGIISILAKVNGSTFEPYYAKNGKKVIELSMGSLSMENMYEEAHSANVIITWLLRLLGTVMVMIGLRMLMAPLEVLASIIPILGNIVGAGASVVSFLLGFSWSLLIIAIAWLRFRPVLGILMLAAAGGLIALLYSRGRKRKAAAAQAA